MLQSCGSQWRGADDRNNWWNSKAPHSNCSSGRDTKVCYMKYPWPLDPEPSTLTMRPQCAWLQYLNRLNIVLFISGVLHTKSPHKRLVWSRCVSRSWIRRQIPPDPSTPAPVPWLRISRPVSQLPCQGLLAEVQQATEALPTVSHLVMRWREAVSWSLINIPLKVHLILGNHDNSPETRQQPEHTYKHIHTPFWYGNLRTGVYLP